MSVIRDVSSRQWTPRTVENELLAGYWRRRGGTLYVEVPVGGPGGPGDWPDGCTVRRLDGVLVRSAATEAWHYSSSHDRLISDLARFEVEIIEVKQRLNRGVIGQAIAGRSMFQRHYSTAARAVILCRAADSALAWVCEQQGVHVEVCP